MIVINRHVLGQCFSCSVAQCPKRASEFLIELSTSKQTPCFLGPKLCIWFIEHSCTRVVLQLGYKCIQKISAIVYGVAANRQVPLLTPPPLFFGWTVSSIFITGYNVQGIKKVESFLTRRALPKTQRRIVTLSYSPFDNTSTAATVALTTGGVLQKYSFLFPHSPLRSTAVAILHLSLQLRWRHCHWEFRYMGCSTLLSFQQRTPYQKRLHLF